MSKINIKPLADRVLVQPSEAETTTSSGIIIPDNAKEKPQKGKVVAVGPGRINDDGKTLDMPVKVGDTVVYSKYAGTEYSENGSEYLIVKESDILAVV